MGLNSNILHSRVDSLVVVVVFFYVSWSSSLSCGFCCKIKQKIFFMISVNMYYLQLCKSWWNYCRRSLWTETNLPTRHKHWSFPLRNAWQIWPNTQFAADLVIFTAETLHGKLHFLCGIVSRKVSCVDIVSCIQYLWLVADTGGVL